jgi:hypothetical protein
VHVRRLIVLALGAMMLTAMDGTGSCRIESGSTPWIVDRASADEARLVLKYATPVGRGISHSLDRIEVDEGETEVRIAVIQTLRLPLGGASWVTFPEYVKVTLREPLGDRRLTHAPVAPEFADLQPSPPEPPSG